MNQLPLEESQSEAKPVSADLGRVLLIVNAKARKGQNNFDQAKTQLKNQGIETVGAYALDNPHKLKPLVEKLLVQGQLDTVIVGGGDGTVSSLAGLLASYKIKLGLLPMGTANDFARNLGIDNNIERSVAIIRAGHLVPVDLGKADDDFFLNVASIGLGVKVAINTNEGLKRWVGPLAYVAAAAQALANSRPIPVRLIFKDRPQGASFETMNHKALQVVIANGRFYGGGLVSAPDETITDGKLAVTVIEQMGVIELLRLSPGLLNGSYVRNARVQHYHTTDVVIETRRPHGVNMDGELGYRTPMRFQVVPGALQVFAPKPQS